MTAYVAFEWIVIALMLIASLRVIWRRVFKPMLQKPKAICGGGGCAQCAVTKR